MKRIVCLLLVGILLCASVVPVSATEDTTISPRFTYISSTATGFRIDTEPGVAVCYAKCETYSESVTIKIVGSLQQYKSSQWTQIASWTVSGTGGLVILDRLKAVSKGYNYRFVATYYIYNSTGTLLESSSATRYYSYPDNNT